MWTEEPFKIDVHNKKYTVQPICGDEHCTRFKISTDCEYMFTLCKDENGNWQMEEDVTPFNEELVDGIGTAIEFFDVN